MNILIFVSSSSWSLAEEMRWKHFGTDNQYEYYYDSRSIVYLQNNCVKVWAKYEPKTNEQYERLLLVEFDCEDRTYRIIEHLSKDERGEYMPLLSRGLLTHEWLIIRPMEEYKKFETLYEIACKKVTQAKPARSMKDIFTMWGLILCAVGAIIIGIFSTHGTSKLWQGISWKGKILLSGETTRITGYLIFVFGFVLQIIPYCPYIMSFIDR